MGKAIKKEFPEIRTEYWYKCDFCEQDFKHQSDCTKHEKGHLTAAEIRDPKSGLTFYKFRNEGDFSAFTKRCDYHTQGVWEGADHFYTIYQEPPSYQDEDCEYRLITTTRYAAIIEEEIRDKERAIFSQSKHLEDMRDFVAKI